jgi:hypothetical protein
VTVNALVLYNPLIKRPDMNWFGDDVESECYHILYTIDTFDGIFFYHVVWSMAIHAQRYGFMARVIPAFVCIPHNVAVGTGFGIATQIRETVCIDKGERSQTDNSTSHNYQYSTYPE